MSHATLQVTAPLLKASIAYACNINPNTVEMLRDNGALKWVFNVSPSLTAKPEFRYWAPGLAAMAGSGGPQLNDLSLEEVIEHIIGVVTKRRLSRPEVEFRLMCSETTVGRLLKMNLLKGETEGPTTFILIDSLKQFLTARLYA